MSLVTQATYQGRGRKGAHIGARQEDRPPPPPPSPSSPWNLNQNILDALQTLIEVVQQRLPPIV